MPRTRPAIVLSIAVLAAHHAASAQQQPPLEPPHYDEPEDNAFDDYVRAGELLPEWVAQRVAEVCSSDRYQPQDVDDIVETADEALAVLREGLPKSCLIPEGLDFSTPLPYLAKCRNLTRLLCVEGRQYEWKGDWGSALNAYLDGLKMAQDLARRGALIHKLVSIACESMLLEEIRACVSEGQPDEPTLARVAERLAELRTSRVLLREALLWEFHYIPGALLDVRENPHKYADDALGTDTQAIIRRADLRESVRDIEAYFREAVARCAQPYPDNAAKPIGIPDDPLARIVCPAVGRALTRSIAADVAFIATETVLALERYRLKRREYPPELAQLVPEFLPTVPRDLFDEQPLKYSRDGPSYFLYSVGQDMIDDGGTRGQETGDIVFHEPL
ncbi:MAG: hypothetical protein ACE5O2_03375 [Armatimonadota bacterium]